ncbi:MAG: TatD family hydrolase [Oscillospiraceae bacterium]|nr:TatD family hydrolase [Oscillospiraceae bacterium]
MLTYIDSHAHYDDEQFDFDRDELLPRLHKNGVRNIVNIGCSLERSQFSVDLAESYPFIYAAVGIHPEDAPNTPSDYLPKLMQWTENPKVTAIGEIGLDYHYDGYDKNLQMRFFEEQLDLAESVNLPVVIHSRDAAEDTMNILRKRGKVNGVMHCFSGSAETARQVLELGMNISFTGVLTFKNARKAIEALKTIPLERLMLETDCPYMAPEPNRGKRCDSGMIVYTIDKIAEIKGISPEIVAEATTENTLRLFHRIAK